MYEQNRSSKVQLIVGSTIAVLALGALVVGALILQPWVPKPIAAPTAFEPYTAADKSFVCEAPAGWKKSGASANAVIGGALFKAGAAKIDITSDLAGSLMGDVANLGGGMVPDPSAISPSDLAAAGMVPAAGTPPIPQRRPAVETLHLSARKELEERFQDYDEKPMQSLQSPLGEGRFSEYTASAGLPGNNVHGYRVTLLGSERRVTVICQCPERDWATLKPAFERVVTSLKPGGA